VRKVWLVIKREYVTRVRTKGFVITTILIPAMLIGFIAFNMAVSTSNPSQSLKIAVADGGQGVSASVAASLEGDELQDGRPAYEVIQAPGTLGTGAAALRSALEAQVRSGQLDGFIWIPQGILSGKKPEFVTRSAMAFTQMDTMDNAIRQAVILKTFQGQGISTNYLRRLFNDTSIRVIRLTRSGETEEKGQSLMIVIAMVVILYVTLVAYGVRTMRSVQEEKTSRIMEILLSSIEPLQLLAGKILGVAAVGLTQVIIWAVSAGLLAAYGITMARELSPGGSEYHIHIPPTLLAFMILYFIGGYLLYSSIYAAIGATVSSEQDAQQLQTPVTMLLVIGFFLFELVMQNPNSPTSIALSIFPFWSPMLMMTRIGLQMPPAWQIALSFGVLAMTIGGVLYFTARIYRVGVLMYGKRPSLAEIVRWFRYS
jgi:ABC-2 type transport system permease protein